MALCDKPLWSCPKHRHWLLIPPLIGIVAWLLMGFMK